MNPGLHPVPIVNLITKPLSAPWMDSARNLPRYLIENTEKTFFRIMTAVSQADGAPLLPVSRDSSAGAGVDEEDARIEIHRVYRHAGRLDIPHADRLRVFRYLMARFSESRLEQPAPLFHFFFTPNPMTSHIVTLLSRLNRRAPVIQTVTSRPKSRNLSGMLTFARRIVSVSEHTRRFLENSVNRRIDMIYPGIPIPPESDGADSTIIRDAGKHLLQESLGLPPGWTVLYAGDLHDSGCMPFWRAVLPEWLRQFPGLQIVIASRPKHPMDGRHSAELIKLGAGRIRCCGTVADMTSLIRACDAMLFPVSFLDAKMDIPMVLLEAMALRKPVVVSDTGPLRELVGTGGVLEADPYRPETFTEALKELIANPERCLKIGHDAYRAVARTFDAKRMAQAYEVLYHEELLESEASIGRRRRA